MARTEVTAAVIASTLTTVVVFLPMVFVRGMSGVMFKQLAYVVGFSLLCSLGRRVDDRADAGEPGAAPAACRDRARIVRTSWLRLSGAALTGCPVNYGSLLRSALNHRGDDSVVPVPLVGGSLALIPLVGRRADAADRRRRGARGG